jgi:hypothetical protein
MGDGDAKGVLGHGGVSGATSSTLGGSRKTPGSGRKKGTPNKATAMGREFAQQILESPAYRAQLKKKADQGRLNPLIEQMLWHYAHGKPAEKVDVTVRGHASLVLASMKGEPT